MEKCRICNTEIPDGSTYCSECMDKEQLKSNESYLDDLLSSVISSSAETNSRQVKEAKADPEEGLVEELHIEHSEETVEDEYISGLPIDVDLDDVHDFDQFNIMEDLNDADDFMDASKVLEMSDKIEINDEDLFGPTLSTASTDEGLNENVMQSEIDHLDDNDTEDIALMDILNELEQTDANSSSLGDIELSEQDPLNTADEQIDIYATTQDEIIGNTGFNNMGLDEEIIDEDILSLLNQMSEDDAIASGIVNLIKGTDGLEEKDTPSSTTDVGDVFSDALSAVSSLRDNDPISEQSNSMDDFEEKKKLKKEKLKRLMVQPEEEQEKNNDAVNSKKADKEKPGLFAKLFAKKKDDKTEKNVDQNEKETDDIESVIQAANNQDKKKSSKKVSKKSKKKTKALQAVQANGDESNETVDSKQVGKKGNIKVNAKKKKVNKKPAKKVKKEVQEVEIDLGKVNPVAASIVMVTFALLALVLLTGTKAFAYSNSIKNATRYFDSHRYTKAYEELFGLEIKDEDAEIFNKVQTVMYVNKQLNSYNNYYAVAKYPEALDSLLKGLKRYEKYIELAIMYGIDSDLDYVRGQILAELDSKYQLSEEKAMQLIALEDETEYSKQIYDIINNLGK